MSRLPVFIRIQENCTPEVATALDILHKEMKNRNLKRNRKPPLGGEEARLDDDIETAIIQALAPLQDTLDPGRVISKTNDYKQTLTHFVIHFGYTNLLRRLVGWKIDSAIADVNGLMVLHCAYKTGDRASVGLLLEQGESEVVLDTLGRAPSRLMPEGHISLNDDDTDMTSDYQTQLEEQPNALSPFQSSNSGHGVSDSSDEGSINTAGLGGLVSKVSPPMRPEASRAIYPCLEPGWWMEGRSSKTLDDAELITDILGIVSLLNCLRPLERHLISDLLELITEHSPSQENISKGQQLPRMGSRQIGTPRQSPFIRYLNPSPITGSGHAPQIIGPFNCGALLPWIPMFPCSYTHPKWVQFGSGRGEYQVHFALYFCTALLSMTFQYVRLDHVHKAASTSRVHIRGEHHYTPS